MSEKFKTKFGFSLFEVLVTMTIVAIFICASSNIFTQKHTKRVALPNHGRFECYYDDSGKLMQRIVSEDFVTENKNVTSSGYCSFKPNKAAAYLVISAVGGGGYGGTTYGGSAGEFVGLFLSSTSHHLQLYPGKAAGSVNENGGTTEVIDKGDDDTGSDVIISAEGGRSDSSSDLSLKNCRIIYAKYTCNTTASCESDDENQKVSVNYCQSDDYYGTSTTADQSAEIAYSTIYGSYSSEYTAEQIKSRALTYTYLKDGATCYSLAVDLDGNYTEYEEDSEMNNYIRSLGITEGIGGLSPAPGNGGAAGQKGGTGAVFITW